MFKPFERIALAAQDRQATQSEWLTLIDSLHAESGFWWLDSAMVGGQLGHLSFAGVDPYLWLRSWGTCVEIDVQREIRADLARGVHRSMADPIEVARNLLPRADSVLYSTRSGRGGQHPGWHDASGLSDGLDLPFLGGAVGYFGYELVSQIEPRVHFHDPNQSDLPDLSLAFVDHVLAYDHGAERLWLLGLGFGDVGAPDRGDPRQRSRARSRAVVDRLENRVESVLGACGMSAATNRKRPFLSVRCASSSSPSRPVLSSPSRSESDVEIESTTDAAGYSKAVDSILEEIRCGNVYQANFSQRLSAVLGVDPWDLYTELRRENPAPFGAYLSLPAGDAVLSSSPERFLRVDSTRRVESRPIKGTRPRGDTELEDARLRKELKDSAKDQAENLMIVDLVRNDLGRVCTPGSIEVPELMKIEAYAAVFQMVSTVTGTLAAGKDAFDLIEGTFPPGSMTGAPKLASIDLLDQLETVRRGVYAGALGYLDLRGGLDLSVVIRTFVCEDGRAHLHVGGGVVADSSPEGEYLESLDKARAPLAALAAAARGAVESESEPEDA
jgi:para-aminobenzoate synthetase component I